MDKEAPPGPVPRGRVLFGRRRKREALGLGCGPAAAETPGSFQKVPGPRPQPRLCHQRPGVGPGRWEPTGVAELRSRPLAGRLGSGLEGGGQPSWGQTCLPGAGLRSGCQGPEPDGAGQMEAGKAGPAGASVRIPACIPAALPALAGASGPAGHGQGSPGNRAEGFHGAPIPLRAGYRRPEPPGCVGEINSQTSLLQGMGPGMEGAQLTTAAPVTGGR